MKLKQRFRALFSLFTSQWALLSLILITSSLFRLTNLTLIEFKGDEGLNLFLATRPLFGHPFPPASLTSSVGILNFPLLNYFLLPIVLVSYFPPFVAFCIALLNVLAIGGFFLIINKYFNRLTAFISALLFSFAPWAILYSRKIWAQDFLLPLVVVLLYCFFEIYKGAKQVYWIPFAITSLFLMQIHQTAGILPILLLIPLIVRHKPKPLFLVIGIVIGLLPTIPYLLFEFANKCPDCSAFLQLHGKLQIYHPDLLLRVLQITNTGNTHTLFGLTDNITFIKMYPLVAKLLKLSYIQYMLIPCGLFVFWKKYKEYRFFIFLPIIIPFVFIALKIQPEMHYVIILLPFLFLFLGTILSTMIMQKNILLRFLGLGCFITFVLGTAFFDYSFFSFLNVKKGFGGDYGSTYAVAYQTAQKTLAIYKNSTSYQEMVLAYYVPKDSIQGNTPIGKILYPLSTLRENLQGITYNLQQPTPDPRYFNMAIAYYTYPENENRNTFFYLKELSQSYSSYQTIYSAALNNYLYTNHLHYFLGNNIWFEYPEHWKEQQIQNAVEVSDENVSFILYFSPIQLPQLINSQKLTTTTVTIDGKQNLISRCTHTQKWCGSYIPSLTLRSGTYGIGIRPMVENLPSEILISEENNALTVLRSLMPIVKEKDIQYH